VTDDDLPPAAPLTIDPAALDIMRQRVTPQGAAVNWFDQLGAAARLENTLGVAREAIEQPERPTFDPVEGYDPLEGATLAEVERFGHRLAQARSPGEAEQIREEYRRRDALEETIAEGPLPPWLAVIGVSIADPINLIPILGMRRVVGQAPTVGRLALAGAYGGAVGGALAEAVISPLQPTREGAETLANILMSGAAGAALLAGLGGIAVAAGAVGARRAPRPGVIEDLPPAVRQEPGVEADLRAFDEHMDAARQYAANLMESTPPAFRDDRALLDAMLDAESVAWGQW